MTNSHDQDAFEIRFESAVNAMHNHTHRANAPSESVWNTIHANIQPSESRAETADPRAIGPDPASVSHKAQRMRKEPAMDVALPNTMSRPAQPSHPSRNWMSWAAIALVGVLLATSVYWYGQMPPADDGNDLAWAPGVGTPESTPMAAGSDLTCNVEPYIDDELLKIVLNPNHEVARLQKQPSETVTKDLLEYGRPRSDQFWKSDRLGPVSDKETLATTIDIANQFWECVATGTTRQVWSLMAPETVQYEILRYLPVIRSESDIEQLIKELGDTPYRLTEGQFGFGGYEDLRDGMYVATASNGQIRVTDEESGSNRVAIVPLYPLTRPATSYIELMLQEYPNGEWRIVDINHPTGRG